MYEWNSQNVLKHFRKSPLLQDSPSQTLKWLSLLLLQQPQTRLDPPSKNSSYQTIPSKYPGLVFGLKHMSPAIWERDRTNWPVSKLIRANSIWTNGESPATLAAQGLQERLRNRIVSSAALDGGFRTRRESLILFRPGIWFWLLSLTNQAEAYPHFCSVIPTTHMHTHPNTRKPPSPLQSSRFDLVKTL